MKPIFYKDKSTGMCYRMELTTTLQIHIDSMLDVINNENTEMITEEEFWEAYEEYEDFDLSEYDTEKVIGVLTTRRIEDKDWEIIIEV